MNSINCMEIVHERSGAAVARWAHNPKVGGSKPPSAIYFNLRAPVAQLDSASDF